MKIQLPEDPKPQPKKEVILEREISVFIHSLFKHTRKQQYTFKAVLNYFYEMMCGSVIAKRYQRFVLLFNFLFQPLPPYTGFGTHEDSILSLLYLDPLSVTSANKMDFIRYVQNTNKASSVKFPLNASCTE